MSRWFEQTAFRVGIAAMAAVAVLLVGALTVWHLADSRVTLSIVVWMSVLPLVLMVLLIVGSTRPWRYASDIERMLAGAAWVHWTVDEAAWLSATESEWRKYRKALAGCAFGLPLS